MWIEEDVRFVDRFSMEDVRSMKRSSFSRMFSRHCCQDEDDRQIACSGSRCERGNPIRRFADSALAAALAAALARACAYAKIARLVLAHIFLAADARPPQSLPRRLVTQWCRSRRMQWDGGLCPPHLSHS